MLFLLFHVGNERYVLEASRIVEVVPLLSLKSLPQGPKGLAGIANYRGQPVPVVDLCRLTVDRPAWERLSTRIIIVKYPDGNGGEKLLGLVAEQATQMIRKEMRDFLDPGFTNQDLRHLGPVVLDAQGVIQWVQAEGLLTGEVRQLVFSDNLAINP